jgi:agmatine deiminase
MCVVDTKIARRYRIIGITNKIFFQIFLKQTKPKLDCNLKINAFIFNTLNFFFDNIGALSGIKLTFVPLKFMKRDRTVLKRRLPAEWEPQSAIQLTFPHESTDWAYMLEEVISCFVQIAETISRFQKVLIVCSNIAKTKALFSNGDMGNLNFVEMPSNDTWARDHGGIVVEEGGKYLLLDFVFNGWGLKFPADKDNLITGRLAVAGLFQAAYQHGGIVLEGGGIESDGLGTLLTTAECMLSPNRNPHLRADEIEGYLKAAFGLERVLWLNQGFLAGDDTDSHIDTLARFCNPDTIAYIQCPDPADEHFEALKKMEAELRQFKKSDDTPYVLAPLPWPDACYDAEGQRLPATYANFLIINGAVLVPTYRVPQDQAALEVFKSIFPDREIIGIDCRMLIEQHGSLHCVTMQYPKGVM